MFENAIKVCNKILKNKYFTKFVALFTLLFITFAVSNPNNILIQTLVYLLNFKLLWLATIIKSILIASVNMELGLLYIINIVVLSSIPLNKKEEFSNIPNMVDKDKIMKYNKNFKEPKKLTELDKKEEKKVELPQIKEKNETKKIRKRKNYAVSEDYYNEEEEKKKKEKNDIDEVNLEEADETIEKELKKRVTNDYRKLEEFDSSSSESSDSNSSDSSTDSSDSEKELDEVSISQARNHMITKLRTGLKKRYINR